VFGKGLRESFVNERISHDSRRKHTRSSGSEWQDGRSDVGNWEEENVPGGKCLLSERLVPEAVEDSVPRKNSQGLDSISAMTTTLNPRLMLVSLAIDE